MASKPTISPEFGYRLASLIDGEGHFGIVKRKKPNGTVTYGVVFAINMRQDDHVFLETFHLATGLGALYEYMPRAHPTRTANKPAIGWRVHNKADCLRLIEILSDYPLWSKKHRDYLIWEKAVRYISGPRPEGWAPMERWWQEIRDVREYDLPPIEVEEAWTLFDELEDTE